MMDERTGRIWQPKVEPTSTPLPGTSQQQHNYHQLNYEKNQQQFFTKTSLTSNLNDNLRSLNREILSASQSYNNTPKPFSRQTPLATETFSPRKPDELIRSENLQQQRTKFGESAASNSNSQTANQARQESQEENMSPKLVHKQYNSPIDLYSMNNIRKTIEAHTELIAPGLKGINFMKSDSPVNKQSEVYKLVMEEEEQRGRLSPALCQTKLKPSLQSTAYSLDAGQNQQPCKGSFTSCSSVDQYHKAKQNMVKEQRYDSSARNQTAPSCCECGQTIVGPFAKIHNRFIHPHCFNCTTCGSSLKNTGYFTINDKLYCEIHAKQVAKMMRIQYNFSTTDDKKINEEHQVESRDISNLSQQSMKQSKGQIKSQSIRSSTPSTSYQPQTSGFTMNNPATISTMFADRSCANDSSNAERREIKWTWKPATSNKEINQVASSTPSSSSLNVRSNSSYAQQDSRSQNSTESHQVTTQFSQQRPAIGGLGRDLLVEGTVENSRVPICVQCHVQIHGPYILAGKTTWCKLCSQTNFNCNSCHRSLLDVGFIEDNLQKYYCENCYEAYYAPICSKCNIRIKGDCLNALGKQWHPSCFVCGHCHRPFGNSSFYLEDNVPYCERDWNILFTTKCYSCSYPIEAGDKWIEALDRNYHSTCFRCTSCQANLEGSTFYCKNGKPYCRMHGR